MLKNLKLVTSTKNLEELDSLQDELAWEEEFTLPRWAYITSEWVQKKNKIAKLRNKIKKLL